MKQSHVEKQLDWCLQKAVKEGAKHRGLRQVPPDDDKAQAHIQRAIRNLEASQYFQKGNYDEWAVSATFYAMYHSLLAILWHFGYESRNQHCTFTCIKHLIADKKITIAQEEVARISSEDTDDIVSLREYYQYGTETAGAATRLQSIQEEAKMFVDKVRLMLKELR